MRPAKAKAGNRDQRGDPVEQVARGAFRAGPHRHRKQHDVAGGKARDGQRADQLGERAVARPRRPRRTGERRSRARRASPRSAAGCPRANATRDAPGRQVDARAVDPGKLGERCLDRVDAGRAVHRRHRQIGLPQPVAERTAGQLQLFAGRPGIGGKPKLAGRRTAGHCRIPPRTTARRTSRYGAACAVFASISTIHIPSRTRRPIRKRLPRCRQGQASRSSPA